VLGRFVSADIIVPEPGNPQALNRYGYALNNPIRYNDPTGHAYECGVYAGTSCADVGPKFPVEIVQAPPDALDNVWAVIEFVGAVVLEPADWVLTARDFLSGQGSPWALVGLLPLVPSSVGKYADEAADALRRAGRAEEAGESIGRTIHHHIATNKNWIRDPQWSKHFRELFAKGGMSLDDAANIVELPAELHKEPHSQAYHQWVYNRLYKAIARLKDPVKIQERLKAALQAIAGELKAHPEWLRNPPIQGGR